MGRNSLDMAWQYCTIIDKKKNHLRCNFCGHEMHGITRFKEHIAQMGADVKTCTDSCPQEIKQEMIKELVQHSLRREEKERRLREALQSRLMNVTPPPPPPSPISVDYNNKKRAASAATADLEAEERAMMEKAVKESLQTFEMEKRKVARYADDEIEAAIRESMRSYREEQYWRRGREGSSSRYYSEAGPSSFGNYEPTNDVDSDYDSDFSF